MKTYLILAAALAIANISAGQTTFQNLDFEAADVSGVQPGGAIATSLAFPDWQALYNTTPFSQVSYDGISIGAQQISIVDNYSPYGLTAIQGNYSADLFAATFPGNSYSVTLSQTALVPLGTQSVELDVNQEPSSSFLVTLGGAQVNMVPVQAFANFTLWGGNVSSFAGQNETLNITELPPANQQFSPSLLELDNITFSPNAVPEPDTLALALTGGAVLAARRRHRRKR